jgi:hypothetical protein
VTLNDLLQLLLVAADDIGRVFDHAEIRTWPPGGLDHFRRLRLLRPSAGGLMAPCPNCLDAHTETVSVREESDGRRRYFIPCPESLRVEVTADMCCGWQIDLEALANLVAASIGLHSAKVVVPGRLWRLGRTKWHDGTRQVVFATRLTDDDASTVACHVGTHGRDIVLVPHLVPDERLWPQRIPPVIALSQVASFDGKGLVLDNAAMAEAVAETGRVNASVHAVGTDRTGRRIIQRAVKSEIKSLIPDEALVAAYREHGSFRKAAEALSAQTETKITKDVVRRAVERQGGIKEVMQEHDTPSVSRTVASQRRDRAKKMSQYGK